MTAPVFSEAVEIMYERLPAHIREADALQVTPDYPLKRWMAGVGNIFGEVATLIDRFDYTTPGDGGTAGDTSDLVDPATADEAWLNWLARLVGYRNIDNRPASEKRALIGSGSAFSKGSKSSVMSAAASVLSGSKRVAVFDHTTDVSAIGVATIWDVCIVTTSGETPSAQAVIDAVVNADAKPAGVKLWHRFHEATWDTIESQNPDWNAIDAKTWNQLQESGL